MTTAQDRRSWTPSERRRVAAAAARAYITMADRDKKQVPDWIREAAAGRPVVPPPEESGDSAGSDA